MWAAPRVGVIRALVRPGPPRGVAEARRRPEGCISKDVSLWQAEARIVDPAQEAFSAPMLWFDGLSQALISALRRRLADG